MIRVSILGATGYSGSELIRILLNHSGCKIQYLTSESAAGKNISDVHPRFRERLDMKFESPKSNLEKIAKESDVVFSCLPPGIGVDSTAKLIGFGVRVIDLSADYRFTEKDPYKKWYGFDHAYPDLLAKRVYGLPELFRNEIAKAQLIANPGCYATAAILSATPLVKSDIVDPDSIIIDAKSGSSGAGKKIALGSIFNEVNENFQPYALAGHRHQPEIESIVKDATAIAPRVTFTPHLVPMTRGICSVTYANLKKEMKTENIRDLFEKTYKNEPFVRVLPLGEVPQTRHVNTTNYCDIGVFQDSRLNRVIIVSALDNLGKGASTQAIQNMNIMFGCQETEGLL